MKTVAFTGRRPQKLPGGFNEDHPLNLRIKQQLEEGIRRAYNTGAREFISGGAVGVDMWAAEAVLQLKNELPDIRLRMVIPFEGQETKWPASSQQRYQGIRSKADMVQVLSSGGYDPKQLFQRNKVMVDQADAVISVFEGKQEGGTWDAINYALGKKKPVWNINPQPEFQAAGDTGHTIRNALAMTRNQVDPESLSYVRRHMRSLRAGMPKSFEDYATSIEQTLNQARVSEPYGALKYANAEFQSSSVDVPGAVQENLGMFVRSKYEALYQSFLKNHPGDNISYEEYIRDYPDARNRVADMPADLSALLRTKVGKASIGAYFPTLKQARTVGDVEEFLFNSVKQGFKTIAGKISGSSIDPEDVLQEMELGYWEKAPLYNRQATNAEGKTVNVPYQIFSQWAAFSRGTEAVRTEEEYQKGIAGTYDEGGDDEIQNGVYTDSTVLGEQGILPSDIGPREEAPAEAGVGQADLAARQSNPDRSRMGRWGGYTTRSPHLEVEEIDPNSAFAKAGGNEGAIIQNIRGLLPEEAAAFADHLEGGGQLHLLVSEPTSAKAGGGKAYVNYRQRRITIQGQPTSRRLWERNTKYDWLNELADRMEPAEPSVTSLEGARNRVIPAKTPMRNFNSGLYTSPEGAAGPLAGEAGPIEVSAKPTDRLNTPLLVGRQQVGEFRDYLAARESGIPESEQENANLIRKSLNRINESLVSGSAGEAGTEHSADEFSAALDAAVRGTDENEGELLAQEFDPYDQDTSVLGNDPQYLEDTLGLEIPEDPQAAEGKPRKWIADKSERSFQHSAKRGVEAVNYSSTDEVIKARREMDQAETSGGISEEAEPGSAASETHSIENGMSVVERTTQTAPPAKKQSNPDYLSVDASDIGSERALNEAYAEANRGLVNSDISSRTARQVASRGRKASIKNAITDAESAQSARFYRVLDHPENQDALTNRRKWVQNSLETMRQNKPRRAANIAYIGARNVEDAQAFSTTLRQVVNEKIRTLGSWISKNPEATNIEEAKRSYNRLRGLKLYQYGKETEWGDQFADFEATEPRLAADIRAASGMPNEAQIYDRLKEESGQTPEAVPARTSQPDTNPSLYNMGMEPDYSNTSIVGRVQARRPRGSMGSDPILGGDRFSEGSGRSRRIEDLPPTRNIRPANPAGGGQPPQPPQPPDDFIDSASIPEPPEDDPDFWNRTVGQAAPQSRRTASQQNVADQLNRLSVQRNAEEFLLSDTGNPEGAREANLAIREIDRQAQELLSGLSDDDLNALRGTPNGGNSSRFVEAEILRRNPDSASSSAGNGNNGRNGSAPSNTQQSSQRSRRTLANEEGPLITHPAAFPKRPRPGMVLEAELPGENGQLGPIRVLEARRNGIGAAAQTVWMEQDEEGNYQVTKNIPGWGTISKDGEVVADVSYEDYQAWEADRARRLEERAARMQAQGVPSKSRRTQTPEEKALAAARGIGVDHVRKLNVRELGAPREITPGSGTYQMEMVDDQWNNQVTVGAETIQSAHGLAQKATADAMQGSLPSNPIARVATIQERIINNALKGVEDFVDKQIKEGVSPDLARANGEKFRQVVKHFADAASKVVGQTLSEEFGIQPGDVSATRHGAVYLKNKEEVDALLQRSPEAKRQLAGRSPEQIAAAGEEFTVIDEEGRPFDIGSYGKYNQYRSNHQGGMGGLWGGKMGSMMYGAYMLSRGWGMAVGPAIAQGQEYGQLLSSLGFSLPEGTYAGSTDAGFTTRQKLGELYMGRAAYQTFGPLMDLQYNIGRSSQAGARILTSGKAAGTIAFDASIAGSMMAMMGGQGSAMAAAGATLGTAGLVVGGVVLAGTLGMEAYNEWFKPEDEPAVEWGNLYSKLNAPFAKQAAIDKLYQERFGWAYQARPEALRGMSHEEWSDAYQNVKFTDEEIRAKMPKAEAEWIYGFDKTEEVKSAEDAVLRIAEQTGEDPGQVAGALSLQKRLFGSWSEEYGLEASRVAFSRGMTSEQQIREAAQYASGLGYYEGTSGFEAITSQYNQVAEKDQAQAAKMLSRSQRVSQYASQLETLFGPDDKRSKTKARALTPHDMQTVEVSLTSDLVERYNLNQEQTGLTASYLRTLQQFGGEVTPFAMEQAASFATTTTPYVAQVSLQAMNLGGMAGMNASDIGSLGSAFSSMNPQDAFVMNRILGGDLQAASYQSWQNGTYANRLFDRSGNPIWETNGTMALQWARANSSRLTSGAWARGNQSDRSLAAILTGSNNSRILDAFLQNGTRGIEALSRIDQANASAALAGIQMRGLELQENFLWGSNAGGKWNEPTTHSAWGIEDQLLSLQHQSTMANFADQQQRMQLSNQFAIRREDNQLQRMNSSHSFSQWQWSTSYNQFNQQQAWARQDWGYQDTTRNLNFGWQMDDLNEAIRFSSGRERRQLVRQRDRAALSHNLEEGQIETQRERQEQLWAQEEERFQKQRQYMLEMQGLDRESFAINKEQRETFFKLDQEAFARRMNEYEEQKKLEDEMRELNRKYQYDQIQLQKEAAAIQAGAAAAQKEYYETLLKTNTTMSDMKGEFEQMNSYNMAFRIANATNEMLKTMDSVNTYRIQKLIELIRTIGTTDPGRRWGGEVD